MKVNCKSANIQTLLQYAQSVLAEAGIDQPEKEAIEILCFSTGLSKARLLADPYYVLGPQKKFIKLIEKRAERFPLQYILGTEYFSELKLKVGPGVLIPRPETEHIIEIVKTVIKSVKPEIIVDLGTGSGNLALSLAVFCRESQVIAVDCSEEALTWARKNRRFNKINNVRFFKSFADKALPKKYINQVDIVVSNPPYINHDELRTLQPEVQYEPDLALDGGHDGLNSIKVMAEAAFHLLKSSGLFLCEIGIGQKSHAEKIFKKVGFKEIEVELDWQAIPRIVIGRRQ